MIVGQALTIMQFNENMCTSSYIVPSTTRLSFNTDIVTNVVRYI